MSHVLSKAWLFALILIFKIHSSEGMSDLFTSTFQLRAALEIEHIFHEDMLYYLSLEEARLDLLEFDLERSDELLLNANSENGRDPIFYYRYLSSLSVQQLRTEKAVSTHVGRNLRNAFSFSVLNETWPTKRDLYGAALGICRLQETYRVTISEIIDMRSPTIAAPTASDLIEISKGCFCKGSHGNSSAWARIAMEQATSQGALDNDTTETIQFLLTHDKDCNNSTAPPNQASSFHSLCVREGSLRPTGAQLLCKMFTNGGQPSLLLQPFKMEVLSEDPRVVVFPEFLSSSECNRIRELATGKLMISKVYKNNIPEGGFSIVRVSKVSTSRLLLNSSRRE